METKDQERNKKEKHGFPAFLSFIIPGLGQLIKGDIVKGLSIWLIPVALFILTEQSLLNSAVYRDVFALGAFTLWIWNISDAYNSNS